MDAKIIKRDPPPALPHGELSELFPDVFFVSGTIALPAPVPVRFSRNMTVVREGERLILINSLRLDEAGLAKLDELGNVSDVIRIAGFHGSDDQFYKERYGARVWAVKGQRYTPGFNVDAKHPYFTPDVELSAESELPIAGASLYVIDATPPEGLLVLERERGIVVSGDCLQNWQAPDEFFSWLARPMMRIMGFIKPHNVGPGWLKQARPPRGDLVGLLELDFDNVLPAHGAPVLGGAKDAYRPAVERAAATR